MTNIVRVTQEMVENEIVAVDYFTASQAVAGACFTSLLLGGGDFNDEAIMERTEEKYNEVQEALDVLTICVVTVKNGFTFVGTSAPVDHNAFDAQKGREIARERAVEQIWKFLAFRIADSMS